MAKDDNIKFDYNEGRFYGVTDKDIEQWKEQYPYLDFDDIDRLLEEASQSIQSKCYKRTGLGVLSSLIAGADPELRRKVYNEVRENPRKSLEDYFSKENLALSLTLSDNQKDRLGAESQKPIEKKLENKDAKMEQEGMIQPKPPEIFQNIIWIQKYGIKHWKLVSLVILIVLFIWILSKINLFRVQ